MANDEKTDNDKTEYGKILSLDDRRNQKISQEAKPKEWVVKRREEVKFKLTPEDAELLEKVRQQEGGNISSQVIFLKALSRLHKLNELQANGGTIYVVYEGGGDKPDIPIDFDE